MKTDLLSANLIENPDVVLIGGGIMSATLGMMLKLLNPEASIQVIEALPEPAQESSHPWNNAGTGHAAFCELNYTPELDGGQIDISKALRINQQFEISKYFWGYLVENGILSDPNTFINNVPHMSFVRGPKNQQFLAKRHAAMVKNHLFADMEFSTDPAVIEGWAPLLMHGRANSETLAATRVPRGTDVNYGELTRQMLAYLNTLADVALAVNTRVVDLNRAPDGRWQVKLSNRQTLTTPFVFIGAGGEALPLLQKSGIPEAKGYGGFPISGRFLKCDTPEVVAQHAAKVYGIADDGSPPMSVPHLDTRVVAGHKSLLFGPYAGFLPKYLKSGSYFDLFKSIRPDNILPMLAVARDDFSLVSYLVKETLQSHEARCRLLKSFYPDAQNGVWHLYSAGQRVQIIKKDPKTVGKLQFGTEVVSAADGSLAAVLGASPGASIAPTIMLDLLEKCFPQAMHSAEWGSQLDEMVPAYRLNLAEDGAAFADLSQKAIHWLKL